MTNTKERAKTTRCSLLALASRGSQEDSLCPFLRGYGSTKKSGGEKARKRIAVPLATRDLRFLIREMRNRGM